MVLKAQPFLQIPSFLLGESLIFSKRTLLIFRAVTLICHLVLLSICIYFMHFIETVKFFTFWGFYITIAYFCLSVLDMTFGVNRTFKRTAIICFEIAFSFEFVITFLYWIFVFPLTKDDCVEGEIYLIVYLHGIVLATLYADFFFNSIVFEKGDIFYVGVFGICYTIVACLWTLFIRPIYPNVNFEDASSIIFIILSYACVFAHFYFGWFVGKYFKTPKITNLKFRLIRDIEKVKAK